MSAALFNMNGAEACQDQEIAAQRHQLLVMSRVPTDQVNGDGSWG
jgi:hypothetical protein